MFVNNRNCERPCRQCRLSSIGKKLCSRFVDGVTAEASHSIALHSEHGFFGRAVTRVIPGAVTSPIKAPSWKGTETGALPLRVGYIGMLTPNKGVSTFGAAAELLGKDAPFEYLIAGDGKPEFVQRVLAKFPASKTSYLGWVNSSSFYPTIDVLVVPSASAEAFGYVCIEALSFGVPVVVARSGGLPEIIEDEKSGLIFKRGDHEALAACLRRMASDRFLLQRLRHGALARAEQYSPEAFAESFDTFLSFVWANARGKKRREGPRIQASRSPIS